MWKKWLLYGGIIVILGTIVAIMTGTDKLKEPIYGDKDDVVLYLSSIEQNIKEQNWSGATEDSKKLDQAFSIVLKRIQFSISREDIMRFQENLAVLQTDIEIQDKQDAQRTITIITDIWDTLGS